MPPESWLVLTVAGAFLLLGIAGSPLAWALFHLRRSQFETAHGAEMARAGRGNTSHGRPLDKVRGSQAE